MRKRRQTKQKLKSIPRAPKQSTAVNARVRKRTSTLSALLFEKSDTVPPKYPAHMACGKGARDIDEDEDPAVTRILGLGSSLF